MRRCPVRTDKLCADISNAAQTSPPSESSTIALGSFGTTAPPRIVRFAASDPVGRDLAYGAGDFFEIEFDMATTRARDEGGRDYLDTLFAFTSMEQGYRNPALPTRLGDEYAATWTDASTFVITLTRSATPALPPPLHRGLGIGVVGDVRTQPNPNPNPNPYPSGFIGSFLSNWKSTTEGFEFRSRRACWLG